MLNRELAAEFADCLPGSKVCVVNPGIDGEDHQRFGVGRVSWLMGSNPVDTIIESSDDVNFIRTDELLRGLAPIDSDGTAQICVYGWEGQAVAYFDIKEVRRGPYLHSIVLGDWRCGG
jgi:hypothetical protein